MKNLESALPTELRPFVSPRVGIVTALEECMIDVDEPPLVRIACELAACDELIGVDLGSARNVGGSGMSRAHAVGAAVGEAVERYSASYVPRERLVDATAAELGWRAADPSSFGLFAESQYKRPGFRYSRFTTETRLPWVDGVDLETGEGAWIPAELVFLADVRPAAGTRIGYATSSGLACSPSADEALERALFELLERDAFMIAWWRRLSPPHLDWSSHPWMQAIDRRYFRGTALTYAALDLSWVHELPIVAAVVRAPGSGAALGVGAAANARVEQAWWRALAEAFASRSACRKLRLLEPERRYAEDGSDVISFDDHIRFYGDDEQAERASFLWSGEETRPAEDVGTLPADAGECRAELLARICRAGSRAFAVDVTAPDVAAAGLHVIRVVAPGLCPLDAEHTSRFLGSRRLLGPSGRDILTGRARTVEDLIHFHTHFRDAADADSAIRLVCLWRRRTRRRSGGELPRSNEAVPQLRRTASPGITLVDQPAIAESMRRSSRRHPHLPRVVLPPVQPGVARLSDVLDARCSRCPSARSALNLGDLAKLLSAYQADGANDRRRVPSGGALYPLELYLLARRVDTLPSGVYHFDPFDRALELLVAGEPALEGAFVDPAVAENAAAILVVTGHFWRSRCKYGLRGYRFTLLEAGHLVQTVLLLATEAEIDALPLGGFYDGALDRLVRADGVNESIVYAVAVGRGPGREIAE